MHLLVSILDFNTLIHMLCHIMSYSCFIITPSTPIFLKFQKSILVPFQITHSNCSVVTMITRMESWWLSHLMYLPLVRSHGGITSIWHLKITCEDITLSSRLFVNSLSMRHKTSPLFENLSTIITTEFFVLMITCNMSSQIRFPLVLFLTIIAPPFNTLMLCQLVSSQRNFLPCCILTLITVHPSVVIWCSCCPKSTRYGHPK